MSYITTLTADAPTALYRLNETSGATARDSVGTNHGTIAGGVTLGVVDGLIPGDADDAMRFDGSTGYIALPVALDPSGSVAFSCEVLFVLPSQTFGHSGRLVANSHTDQDHKGFQVSVNGNGAGALIDAGNGTASGDIFLGTTFTAGQPYQMVLTYDGATVRAYVNGALAGSAAVTGGGGMAAGGFPINIARNPAYTGDYAPATIHAVALWTSKVLSAAQVLAHWNAALTLADAGAVALADAAVNLCGLADAAVNLCAITNAPVGS